MSRANGRMGPNFETKTGFNIRILAKLSSIFRKKFDIAKFILKLNLKKLLKVAKPWQNFYQQGAAII